MLQRSASHAALTFLTYAFADSEISSSLLLLVARRLFRPFSLCLVRFGRSSSFLRPCPYRACVVVLSPAFRVFFFLYYLGFRFTCYRRILCFIPSHSFPLTTVSIVHSLPASSIWFGPISFFLLYLLLIAFYVSYPDASLDLCDFAVEPLTS